MNGMQLDEHHDADAILRDQFDDRDIEEVMEEEVTELELGGDSKRTFELLQSGDDYGS